MRHCPRIVLTGGPSVGKSTTLKMLKEAFPSWRFHEEQAAILIREGRYDLSDPADGWRFQLELNRRLLEVEALYRACTCGSTHVFDRHLESGLAYTRHHLSNSDPASTLPREEASEYVKELGRICAEMEQHLDGFTAAFVLLPLGRGIRNDISYESDLEAFQAQITPRLKETCAAMRTEVLEVEALAPEPRVGLVLWHTLKRLAAVCEARA